MNARYMAIYPNARKTITDIFFFGRLAAGAIFFSFSFLWVNGPRSSSILTQTPGAVFFFLFLKAAFTTAKNKKTTKNN